MKTGYCIVLLFLFISTEIFSQSGLTFPCGTAPITLSREKILKNRANIEKYKYMRGGNQVFIPLQIHITGTDAGTGYFPIDNMLTMFCDINQQYAPLGIKFYLWDMPIYINNSAYHDHDHNKGEGEPMVEESFVYGVANIYVVNTTNGACGYAWYPGSGPMQGGVILQKDCAGSGATTLAHELGHYFSLPHTFSGWEYTTPPDYPWNVEYVDGSNCESGGDYFCDTRADFIADRWSCPYSGSFTDPNGDVYNPDETLYMSYALDNCQQHHSVEQIAQIKSSVNNDRPYLMNHPLPDTSDLGIPVLYEPANLDTIKAGMVTFRWSKVPGADYYILFHAKGTLVMKKVFMTTDTSFTSTFNFNYHKYKWSWKVKAITKYKTCTNYSAVNTFVTDTSGMTTSEFQPIEESVTKSQNFNIISSSVVSKDKKIFIIESNNSSKISLSVFAMDGRLLYCKKILINNGQNEIDMNQLVLPSGLYIMDIHSPTLSIRQKIMIL